MNFYQFLKSIQEGVGDGCKVVLALYNFGSYASGLEICIVWENDFRYKFVMLETHIENDGFLEHFSDYIIKDASRKFRIAEVGED